MKLVTAAEMRAIEAEAFASGATAAGLMENAGRAVAEAVRERLGSVIGKRIVVLVGPGNNGGDGLVAARYLHDSGASVLVWLLTSRPRPDPNLEALAGRTIDVVALGHDPSRKARPALEAADAVIDAVLGTGRQRPLEGQVAAVFDLLKQRRAPLFAIDLPSGLDPDSGALDPHAAAADVTLALGFSKLGLHVWPGSHAAGEVKVLDIGLAPEAGRDLKRSLITRSWAASALPGRPGQSNKGTFGRVLVVAGSEQYTGAAALCALGALRTGAGLVTVASIPSVRAAVAAYLPEATHLVLPEDEGGLATAAGDLVARALPDYDALVIGPGLGQAAATRAAVRGLLSLPETASLPVVIDADALNALARWPRWAEELTCRAVLTPHPGELARLSGGTVAAVQQDRLATAERCARDWRQTLVLKGANTVVATPEGYVSLSPYANALLATAGSGDVLAGAIAGLLAQGVAPDAAASLGVYLHGGAAETLSTEYGASGLLAGELGAAIARFAAALRRQE